MVRYCTEVVDEEILSPPLKNGALEGVLILRLLYITYLQD